MVRTSFGTSYYIFFFSFVFVFLCPGTPYCEICRGSANVKPNSINIIAIMVRIIFRTFYYGFLILIFGVLGTPCCEITQNSSGSGKEWSRKDKN